MGDEITFAAPTGDRFGTEALITKHAVSGRNRYFYQAPIGYVTQPTKWIVPRCDQFETSVAADQQMTDWSSPGRSHRALTDGLAAGGGEAKRAFAAMMTMKKIDIAAIDEARLT